MNAWINSIKFLVDHELCLDIVKKLYTKGKQGTLELGDNPDALRHAIPKLVRAGMVSSTRRFRDSSLNELTSLGMVVACLLFEDFKNNIGDVSFEGVLEKEPLFVGRVEEVREVLFHLKRKRHVLVLGKKGMGKTCFLKFLVKNHLEHAVFCKKHRTPKDVLISLAAGLGLSAVKKTGAQLHIEIEKTLKKKKAPILILDNAHKLSPSVADVLEELSAMKVVFLGAAPFTPKHYEFKKAVELKRLSKEESVALVRDLLRKSLGEGVPEEIVKNLVKGGGGLPGKIAEKCEEVQIGAEVGDFDPKDEKSIEEFSRNLEDDEPVISIGKNFFMKLAYFLLSIKFLLYMNRDYERGYFFAMSAYLIFTFFRYWGKPKRK